MRIFELAKEIGQSSKVLIEALKKQGASVESHMSAIDERLANALRGQFAAPPQPQEEKPPEEVEATTIEPENGHPAVAEAPPPPQEEKPAEEVEATTIEPEDRRPAVKGNHMTKAMPANEPSEGLEVKGVVIIGPDASTRQELSRLLETVAKVIGEAPDYSSGYTLATTTNPDVIFIDLSPDPGQGVGLIEKLVAEHTASVMFVVSKEKNPDLILEVMRLGVRDFFVLPDDEAAISLAIGTLTPAMVEKAPPPRGKILTVFSLLGGCGVTTLATNLAGCLALDSEKKTVLFDLDLYKGDVSFFLNIDTPFTITDFHRNLGRIDTDLLDSSMAKHPSGLFVLGHPKSYEEIEDITGEHLEQVIKKLRQHYDFVVVDCLKAINDIFLAVMDASDLIVLITLQTVPALKDTKRCLELFEQLGYNQEKIKVVLNRFAKKKLFSVDNVEKTLNWPITATLTKLEQEATEAMNAGRLLHDAFPKAKLTQEIFSLGETFAGETFKVRVARRSGLFSFLKKEG